MGAGGWQKEEEMQQGLSVGDHFAMEVKVNYEESLEWFWAIWDQEKWEKEDLEKWWKSFILNLHPSALRLTKIYYFYFWLLFFEWDTSEDWTR